MMDPPTPPVVKHLEHHLGEATGGWGDKSRIQVLHFPARPEPGIVTYATLGLSDAVLPMGNGRTVRQELLLAVRAAFDPAAVAGMLTSFADYVVGQGRALLRGDVVGPSDPLIPGVEARAVYAAMPVVFPEGIDTMRESTPPTVFVWLAPLRVEDAEYVRFHGWSAFEDALERVPLDFWDLNRAPLPHD
jgi:hypothetical protein